MTGDTRFALLVVAAGIGGIAIIVAAWLKDAARRWWVRNAGCPACAYQNQGPCACARKCVNPDCKGAGR